MRPVTRNLTLLNTGNHPFFARMLTGDHFRDGHKQGESIWENRSYIIQIPAGGFLHRHEENGGGHSKYMI